MNRSESAAIWPQVRRLVVVGSGVWITFAAQLLITFIETVIVARLGADALAGVTIALSLYVASFLFSLGVVTAVTPLAATAYGKGDLEGVRNFGQQGVLVALMIATPLMVALFGAAGVFASMSAEYARFGAAAAYLTGAAPGLPLWTIYVAIRCFGIATGRVYVITGVMVAAIPIYTALAIVLTFGLGPIPKLGVFGSGLAYTLTALIIVTVTALILKYINLTPTSSILIWRPKAVRSERKEILSLGIPFAFRIVLREGVLPATTLIVAVFGADVIAAHAVASRLGEITSSIAFGISSAVNAEIGYMLGSNEHRQTRLPVLVGVALALIVSIIVSATVVVFSESIATLMLGNANAISITMALQVIPIAMLWFIVVALQAPLSGTLSAFKAAKFQLWTAAAGSWMLGIPIAYGLSRLASVPTAGAWIGLTLGELSITALFFWKVYHLISRHQLYAVTP
ncbi:hypothetical protein DRB17_13265 [Ferruginivarius sediminum]|uniref:Uncharacterized protein n=1 Tax=Ferruginivarius sediminum TaxID=2661937 RepID=A0A369T7Y0_9PROT|nr:hypothetical protein DRB17_13265 [Ferruginivarius sediminum]